MIRIILTDDHTLLRNGLRALLARVEEVEVVGEAANGQELLDMLETTPAEVVLMDVGMPVLDGLATLPFLRQRFPAVKVLALSMLDHEEDVSQMLDAGALGYALKTADATELAYAIRTVAAGKPFLSTAIGLDALARLRQLAPRKPAHSIPELSARELEVLMLIGEGLTSGEIADQLFTSKRTVESHRLNILDKLQVKNTAALIKYAVRHGLIA
ncbi:response regulator transcription factor [Hymenobacter lutimineralis]|uniref:Response regulator transcription factor n=1 Tax=Hymenobacter lutimineralis TaxID=2606448 RepID=A0A5D6VBU5_9BACT|nr:MULTISPECIES: response regulator transcription factor [Hymenobacter]QIX61827.1 response regulator transcription factor [Hymenobacter sp. BT18]TYZ12725.1 response regulator transcription factor [Hymenobacter lutimineralis]